MCDPGLPPKGLSQVLHDFYKHADMGAHQVEQMPLILPIVLNNLQTRQHLVKTLLTQKSRCGVRVKLQCILPRPLRLCLVLDRPVDLQVHQEYLELEFQGRTLSQP